MPPPPLQLPAGRQPKALPTSRQPIEVGRTSTAELGQGRGGAGRRRAPPQLGPGLAAAVERRQLEAGPVPHARGHFEPGLATSSLFISACVSLSRRRRASRASRRRRPGRRRRLMVVSPSQLPPLPPVRASARMGCRSVRTSASCAGTVRFRLVAGGDSGTGCRHIYAISFRYGCTVVRYRDGCGWPNSSILFMAFSRSTPNFPIFLASFQRLRSRLLGWCRVGRACALRSLALSPPARHGFPVVFVDVACPRPHRRRPNTAAPGNPIGGDRAGAYAGTPTATDRALPSAAIVGAAAVRPCPCRLLPEQSCRLQVVPCL